MIPTNVSKILDNLDNIKDKKRAIQHIIWHLPDGLVNDKERDDLISELNILAETPEEYKANVNKLLLALRSEGTVKLDRDLETTSYYIMTKNTEVDFNGHEIISGGAKTYDAVQLQGSKVIMKNGIIRDAKNNSIDCNPPGTVLFINKNTDLTLENMDIKGIYPIWSNSTGNIITIKSGKYESTVSQVVFVQKAGSKVIIEGGEFYAPDYNGVNYCLNLKDGIVSPENYRDCIEVRGGRFIGFNPAEVKCEKPTANFVADGYKSVEIEPNIWEVFPE